MSRFDELRAAAEGMASEAYNTGYADGYATGVEDGKHQMWNKIATIRELEARTDREDGFVRDPRGAAPVTVCNCWDCTARRGPREDVSHSDPLD